VTRSEPEEVTLARTMDDGKGRRLPKVQRPVGLIDDADVTKHRASLMELSVSTWFRCVSDQVHPVYKSKYALFN
jgi:hypothetical protein